MKKRAMIVPAGLCALGVLLLSAAVAQRTDEDQPPGWLRFLPVGESPPVRQEVRDGVRYLLPPPPGSVPPRMVSVGSEEGRQASAPVQLKLRTLSARVLATPGAVPIREVVDGGSGDSRRWHELRMPNRGAVLAVLWRDPQARSWTRARSLVLADDLEAFPGGTIRFTNVSPFPAGITFGDEKLVLAAGKVAMQGEANTGLPETRLAIEVADANGNSRKIYDSAIVQRRNQRTSVIIFRADGARPRNPAKVHIATEQAVVPKPPR
ncbi:MAG: hypothetical protein HKN82_13220 [Akkermansiaceae bacterium]|nr:hypothetical protein [Akkermansiaceae bacterium]